MREQGSIVNISNLLSKISQKAGSVHDRVPFIRKLPKQCVGIILLLVVINIIVWIAAGVILVKYFNTLFMSFSFHELSTMYIVVF